jgi:PPK2 family polyphosphate:nucleotide phosphotransferase
VRRLTTLCERFLVKPGQPVRLSKWDPGDTAGYSREEAEAAFQRNVERLFDLQYLLSAQRQHALLIVLQAMDAGGKDGTIRNVMRGLNPQGCQVTPFRPPSEEEREHDFLWRVHHCTPRKGNIGIFNRSHYEDVLVVRVKKLAPKPVWSQRYRQINEFERILVENSTTVVKFFLHISKNEQADRLRKRLEDPRKNWKLSPDDADDRRHWDDYMQAYQDALSRCSTAHAPWYVIPANRKWFRDLAVSQVVIDAIERMHLKMPKPAFDLSKIVIQ